MSSFQHIFRTPNRTKPKPPTPTTTFPSNTPIRITNDSQQVNPIGMAYWNNINYHAMQPDLNIVLSIADELILLVIDKSNLQIKLRNFLGIHHTGEGIYFSKIQSDILYIPYEKKLVRFNINTRQEEIVWQAWENENFWQCHSSWDDNVHSATIKDSNYVPIRWGVRGKNYTNFFEIKDAPDECQIDKLGNWLVIKEGNDNRIIDLSDGEERIILNSEGALGHSDCGFGTMVGENDQDGFLTRWDLNILNRTQVSNVNQWNMGYVAWSKEFYLISGGVNGSIYKVSPDGKDTFVCHDMNEKSDYMNRTKANLCPLGEYAIWTAWVNGRRDAFLVKL